MNFEQLLYAEVLSHHSSMQTAADVLHISKSGLSIAVSQLEEELGVKLFSRTSRGTKVTPEGQQMLASISEILRSKNALEKTAMYVSNPQSHQRIRISYMNTMLKPFINNFIDEYETRYSNTLLDITCHEFTSIIQQVRDQEIDAGFIAISDANFDTIKSLNFTPICHSKLVLICSPENLICQSQGKVTLEELQSQRFSLFNDKFHDLIFERLQFLCGPLSLVLRVDDSWAMTEAITKLNTVSFGRIVQGVFSRDNEIMNSKTEVVDIGHIIDDNFILGWLTNPNYKISDKADHLLKCISKNIKRDAR
jgi:DNA-binding transcriptional LysR family regulator